MEPNANGQQPFAASAKSVAEHASTLTRLELELALLELKRKAISLGIGVGMAAAAGALGLIGLVFVFATVAAGLSTTFPVWVACAMTTAILFIIASFLGIFAIMKLRKATPPVPEQAIEQAKLTGEAIKR